MTHLVARGVHQWLGEQGFDSVYGTEYERGGYSHILVRGSGIEVGLSFTTSHVLADRNRVKVLAHTSPTVWGMQHAYLSRSELPARKPVCELCVEFNDPDLLDAVASYIDYRFAS